MTQDEPIASIRAFEILTKLSSGGMGDVLLARRRGAHGFEKLLAVKTIRGDLAKRADIRAMFLDEARLVARLDHPSIANVYDFGEEEGILYIAMEYVSGIALNKLMVKRQCALPAVVALRLAAEVCRGIHAAHELTDLDGKNLGVVHRDLSPGNMILTFDGHVKILDFGIAFMHERESPDTQVGELKGKPSYMAPEQLRAERVDRRSDIYSLSVVLHEMMTGRKLFTKNNVVATVLAVERGDVPRPSELNSELPHSVDGVIMKGLSKDATSRYQSAKEMATALDGLISEMGNEPTLEAFVDHALIEEQRTHRSWLSAVLSGDFEEAGTYERFVANPDLISAPPAQRERSITKNEKLQEEVRPLVGSTTLVPPQSTADVTSVHKQRERRRQLVATAAGIAFVFLVGGLAYYQTNLDPIAPESDLNRTVAAQPADEIEYAPPPAVAEAIEMALDAAPAITPEVVPEIRDEPDPPKHRKKKARKRRAEHDSPSVEPPSRGAPAAFGLLTIGAEPYALVRIDGKEIGVTPIMKRKVPTGRHSIQLVRPDTGEVRLEKVVSLDEGQHERITLQ